MDFITIANHQISSSGDGTGGFRDKETKGDMRVKKEGENEGRKLKIKDLKEEREERKELKQE